MNLLDDREASDVRLHLTTEGVPMLLFLTPQGWLGVSVPAPALLELGDHIQRKQSELTRRAPRH